MRLLVVTVAVVFVGLLIGARAQVVTEPKFQIEIQTSSGSPRFSVKNLSAKTLVACTISYSISAEARPEGRMNWNPLVRAGHGPKGEGQGPLEPSQTLTFNLPHIVGRPIPDKVEVIAGIWADGETFGQAVWVKSLVDMNASMVAAYEQAIALLQEGIEHNWTREQYLAALDGKPDSSAVYSIRQTFLANQALDQHPQLAKKVAQGLLAHFEQDLHRTYNCCARRNLRHKSRIPKPFLLLPGRPNYRRCLKQLGTLMSLEIYSPAAFLFKVSSAMPSRAQPSITLESRTSDYGTGPD